jgi:hypothetical protein
MYSGQKRRLNYGYKYLESVYDQLGIADFIRHYAVSTGFRGTYSLDEIFRLLVLMRILEPDSKRASTQRQTDLWLGPAN